MTGLVYVKKVGFSDEPFTFTPETANPLEGLWVWAHACFKCKPQDPLPAFPLIKEKKISRKDRIEARHRFLERITMAEHLSEEQWDHVVASLVPVLGEAWEEITENSNTASQKQTWLEAGQRHLSFSSPHKGYVGWMVANVKRLKKAEDIKSMLPLSSSLEPWNKAAKGVWAYEVLEEWWKHHSQFLKKPSKKPVEDVYAPLVATLDEALSRLPQPFDLPFHWRVCARHAQACIQTYASSDFVSPLNSLDIHQPVHCAYVIDSANPNAQSSFWMGEAEWQLARFSQVVRNLGWNSDYWRLVSPKVSANLHQRGTELNSFMEPFYHLLLQSAEKGVQINIRKIQMQTGQKLTESEKNVLKKEASAALDRWKLDLQTPLVQESAKRVVSRRL